MAALRLDKSWWFKSKHSYIFDPNWLESFRGVHPMIDLDLLLMPNHDISKPHPHLGHIGIVFWHDPNGQTVVPVGVITHKGEETVFCYHPSFVDDASLQAISFKLPKTKTPYVFKSEDSLLPYFDNLVSEGWLGMMQRNACHQLAGDGDIKKKVEDFELWDDSTERFNRLLTFGRGFHGAVAIVDALASDQLITREEQKIDQSIRSYSTLGGAQPKMLVVKQNGHFRPAKRHDISTHIAKLPSPDFPRIAENEYLNIIATRALLPNDQTVEAEIGTFESDPEKPILFIKRFDRTPNGARKHFEEALQIVGKPAKEKYDFHYNDLAQLSRSMVGEYGVTQIFKRVLAQLLMGNTDQHMKNFAFWQEDGRMGLTPNYDLVSTDRYQKSSMALRIGGEDLMLYQMQLGNMLELTREFGLGMNALKVIAEEFKQRLPDVKRAVKEDPCPFITPDEKHAFCEALDYRFNRQLGALFLKDDPAKDAARKNNDTGWGGGTRGGGFWGSW